jgi:hypothetical protein
MLILSLNPEPDGTCASLLEIHDIEGYNLHVKPEAIKPRDGRDAL